MWLIAFLTKNIKFPPNHFNFIFIPLNRYLSDYYSIFNHPNIISNLFNITHSPFKRYHQNKNPDHLSLKIFYSNQESKI